MNWKNNRSKPKVLAIASDTYGCGFYRVYNPMNMMKKLNLADVMVTYQGNHPIDVFDDQRLSQIDILLGQRIYNKEWLAGIFTQRDRYGFSFVYEIDDSLDTIDPSNPAFKFFRYKNKQEVLDIYHNALKYSDAAFTTIEYLAKECEQWVDKAYVLSNGISPEEIIYDNIPLNSNSDKVRIMYHGGSSHAADIPVVLNALEQALAKHENVELFFWGFMPELGIEMAARQHGSFSKSYEYFVKFYKKFRDRIKFYPFVDTELFHPIMSTFQIDFAIAPLKGSKFDNAKSELKAVECGFLGVPIITSDVFPYRKIIKNNENGFIAKKPSDWNKYLDLLIKNKELRIKLGKNLKKVAYDKYTLEKISLDYLESFKKIHSKEKPKYSIDWWKYFNIEDKRPEKSKMVFHNS